MLRLVVLASGTGSLAQAVIEAAAQPGACLRVVALGADRDAPALVIARDHGLPTFTVRPADFPNRTLWDQALTRAVATFTPDAVVSAGFMRILGPAFLAAFEGRTLNTHPALLPAFPGAHAVAEALAAGVDQTGCTIHWVDSGVDSGPIIAQRPVPVNSGDTESDLHERIKVEERAMLLETLSKLATGGLTFPSHLLPESQDNMPDAVSSVLSDNSTGTAPAAIMPDAASSPLASALEPEPTPLLPANGDSASLDQRRSVRRALISVYDKTGLVDLAMALDRLDVEIVSTGSTAQVIADAGIAVTPVEQLTGFPECLDGRVKTLHPRVHAGILADLRKPTHQAQLDELEIEPFGLVVVNLYPFSQTVASGAAIDQCVEQIDIGGPSMVRAAAKNHPSVAIVTSPGRYAWVIDQIAAGGLTLTQRAELAREAFIHTAEYDIAVANWMSTVLVPEDGSNQEPSDPSGQVDSSARTDETTRTKATDQAGTTNTIVQPPLWRGLAWRRSYALRYGENPHQAAAVYATMIGGEIGLATAEQLGGKAMSYNNYVDADSARRAVLDFTEPAVAIIKHANPCGLAIGADIAQAHIKAHACDPVSAYGGVIATNRPVTLTLAEQIAPIFTEVIVAPDYEPAALARLQTKKNLRILRLPLDPLPPTEFRQISGGLLVQTRDQLDAAGDNPANWTIAAGPAVSIGQLKDLEFAWRACRAVKSNAILLARDGASVGIGMGQVNRVDSCQLAVCRAGAERAKGAVAASDAFFPFADGLQILLDAGVTAIVQPGGSIRDAEVIAAAQAAGATLYLTGSRHFFH